VPSRRSECLCAGFDRADVEDKHHEKKDVERKNVINNGLELW